jgi:hypothetical protein
MDTNGRGVKDGGGVLAGFWMVKRRHEGARMGEVYVMLVSGDNGNQGDGA